MADGVFFIKNKPPEKKFTVNDDGEQIEEEGGMDEEELKKFLKPQFQKNIYPDSVIIIGGKINHSKEFIKNLSDQALKDNHWTEDDLLRRWLLYEGHNSIDKFAESKNSDTPSYPMVRFF